MLASENIFLRTLQLEDADLISKWENNPDNWEVSGTKTPFSTEEILAFVTADDDVVRNKQIRYLICLKSTKTPIGTIDLFEYDEKKKAVGVGVLIADIHQRKRGFAFEALELINNYCSNELKIVTIFCNITIDNEASIRLFEKNGFQFIEERLLFSNKVKYYELQL